MYHTFNSEISPIMTVTEKSFLSQENESLDQGPSPDVGFRLVSQ
jgi:hypothetical protein